MVYDVEFDDGDVKEYSANVIAEELLSQVDDEGFTLTHLDAILDHRKDSTALDGREAYATTKGGQRRLRKSTRGWSLMVRWTDGTKQWVPLSDLKESYPVRVAEYAKARGIQREPAFAWWVPYTVRKREAIVSQVHARTRKVTHKYKIKIPRDVKHTYTLDQANSNDLWAKLI